MLQDEKIAADEQKFFEEFLKIKKEKLEEEQIQAEKSRKIEEDRLLMEQEYRNAKLLILKEKLQLLRATK